MSEGNEVSNKLTIVILSLRFIRRLFFLSSSAVSPRHGRYVGNQRKQESNEQNDFVCCSNCLYRDYCALVICSWARLHDYSLLLLLLLSQSRFVYGIVMNSVAKAKAAQRRYTHATSGWQSKGEHTNTISPWAPHCSLLQRSATSQFVFRLDSSDLQPNRPCVCLFVWLRSVAGVYYCYYYCIPRLFSCAHNAAWRICAVTTVSAAFSIH